MNRLSPRDVTFMRQALDIAAMGRGLVEPNPMVGAVIVRDNKVVGAGYHQRYGDDHAEINAINDCKKNGVDPAGLTMFVTLEPCCHSGKTGPCTKAILAAKLMRVVIAMQDPFEKVSGKGIEQLKQAGIDVTVGVCEAQALDLNEAFIKRVTTGLPWMIGKWAQTVDGKTATTSGDSKWISCYESREVVHKVRARVDAIMVGVRTVELDDPALDARHVHTKRAAKRIVIDPSLRIPMKSKLVHDDGPPVYLITSEKAMEQESERVKDLEQHGLNLLPVPMKQNSRLDMHATLRHLVDLHLVTNVLVEGGASLMGSLFADELLDQLLVFIAPRIAGDQEALSAVHGHNLLHICDTHHLSLRDVTQISDDILLDYRVIHPNSTNIVNS
ncbi:bifunctional diaminohydroxyphosphoribosylaminopyrimidine deaminase/5-amino-6-(5-phosphoribosylamino)uracil reductase RibD [Poriferisphaera sp. WC338]|uniref:bifunctional diaminohydroxyphosphoribosylaminopyrimidine deaminase/5-amino-6-(5-phosphoribosylamino)uracil reductase RibD n=1 Tax=Poriferisphaera sp. WC338 TaxID=3425129 RepID=UPI003D81A498